MKTNRRKRLTETGFGWDETGGTTYFRLTLNGASIHQSTRYLYESTAANCKNPNLRKIQKLPKNTTQERYRRKKTHLPLLPTTNKYSLRETNQLTITSLVGSACERETHQKTPRQNTIDKRRKGRLSRCNIGKTLD